MLRQLWSLLAVAGGADRAAARWLVVEIIGAVASDFLIMYCLLTALASRQAGQPVGGSGVNAATASSEAVAAQRWAALFALGIVDMYLTQRLAARRFIGVFADTAADLRQRFAAQVRAAPLTRVPKPPRRGI
jgi:hypothetical protein